MHGSDIFVKKEGFLVLCTILRIFLQSWFSTIYWNLDIEKVLKRWFSTIYRNLHRKGKEEREETEKRREEKGKEGRRKVKGKKERREVKVRQKGGKLSLIHI